MMLTEITYKHNELHQLCQNIYKVIFHFVPVMGILCARVPVFKNYFHFFPPFLSECASLSLYVCVCVGGVICVGSHRDQDKSLNVLELVSQAAVSCHTWVWGTKIRSSERVANAFNCRAISSSLVGLNVQNHHVPYH